MNELSELLVSTTTDTVSAQPIKLNENLVSNTIVQSELESRKKTLEQLQVNIRSLKPMMSNQKDADAIRGELLFLHVSGTMIDGNTNSRTERGNLIEHGTQGNPSRCA